MAKNDNQSQPKTGTVISKTMSGSEFLITLQEGQGCVHTLNVSKEESSQYELGDKIKLTLQKVE